MATSLEERFGYHPDPCGAASNGSRRRVDSRCRLIMDQVDFTGRRVLDLGCNGGYFGFALAGVAGGYLGVDADSALIARNREAARRCDLATLEFHAAPITPDLIRGLGRFDVALFLSVFHHILAGSAAYDWNRRVEFDPLELVAALHDTAGVLVFETGYPDEGFEWCARLPAMLPTPRAWVEHKLREAGFARVRTIPASAYHGAFDPLKRRVARALGYARHPRPLSGKIASRLLRVDPRDGRDLFVAEA